ncbi:YihY/virulence factor BrkB family protein [Microbacterium soli]|uniref:YihY/virulence factor BrkB family protein n=1 Tax=Microbacterium soli TaxID=446075 RepID=A0ABP7NCW6_9MICO
MRARLIDSAGRAAVLARRTAALFPVRVWRRFLQRNGFLLSAGMAYQALFALFALVYAAFAAVGVWLSGDDAALQSLIRIANSYLPGIIGEGGIATPDEMSEIARSVTGAFTVTGLIAAVVLLWTAISAVTFTRRAVRDIFGLPFDDRSFVLLKLADAAAALAFGLALLVGAAVSVGGVWALTQLLDLFGLGITSTLYNVIVRSSSVIVVVAIDLAAIALLVRFLTGTSLPWRTIWPGAALGGAAVTVLQLGAGLLFARSPGNPLLATFAVMVALLLWCRAVAVVILVAASWIAQSANDRGQPLVRPDVGGPR